MKVQEVLPHFNGKKARLAAALGVSRAAIARWGEDVPPRRVYEIERILELRRDPRTPKDILLSAVQKMEEARSVILLAIEKGDTDERK